MNSQASVRKKSDKWIPFYFVIFFFFIFLVDGVFVTTAIRTQTGMVTKDPYEKGLTYNKIIEEAGKQNQIGIVQKATFSNGTLMWKLYQKNGASLDNAKVTAHFYRPAKDGNDFDVTLTHTSMGTYEIRPPFSHSGLWVARLEAQWQNLQAEFLIYKTAFEMIAP